MQFSERELEDWFYENPERFASQIDCTCGDFTWIGRQVRVPSGIIDLMGLCACDKLSTTLYVVELKAEKIRSSALCQTVRYAFDISHAMSAVYNSNSFTVGKYCVGTGAVDDAIQYAANAMGVRVITVLPSFCVHGPWGWTDERDQRDEVQRLSIGQSIVDTIKALNDIATQSPQEGVGHG